MDTMKNWKQKFFILYTGQAFSVIGSSVVQFAIIWYLTMRTQSAVTLTIATIVGFLPGIFLGSYAGVMVDRHNRKIIIILADAFIAVSSIALAVAFWILGNPPVWFIYLILFLRGMGSSFHFPALKAVIPQLVPQERLVKVGGWSTFITSGSGILAPMLGSVLMGLLDMYAIVLVDVMGAFFAIICLLFLKVPNIGIKQNTSTSGEQKNSFISEFKEGLAAVKQDKSLRKVLPHYFTLGFLYFPLSSLFPLLVYTHYMGTEKHNALVNGIFGLGMMICSFVLGTYKSIDKKLILHSSSGIILGICTVAVGLLTMDLFVVTLVFMFFMGASSTLFNVPFYAYIQSIIAPENMGRVMSLLYIGCMVGNTLGLVVAGPVGNLIGISPLFAYIGILLMINGIVALLRVRKPELQRLATLKKEQLELKG